MELAILEQFEQVPPYMWPGQKPRGGGGEETKWKYIFLIKFKIIWDFWPLCPLHPFNPKVSWNLFLFVYLS